MITLGLDLSTVASGYSIFDGDQLIKYGIICPDSELSQGQKYFYITQYISTLIKIYRPTDLSIEDTFYSKDPTVLKKLNRIAGQVMYCWFFFSKKEPYFYMASSARGSIGVSGKATKEEVTEAVNKFFKLRGKNQKVEDDNVADAIVIGWHHVSQHYTRKLRKTAKEDIILDGELDE